MCFNSSGSIPLARILFLILLFSALCPMCLCDSAFSTFLQLCALLSCALRFSVLCSLLYNVLQFSWLNSSCSNSFSNLCALLSCALRFSVLCSLLYNVLQFSWLNSSCSNSFPNSALFRAVSDVPLRLCLLDWSSSASSGFLFAAILCALLSALQCASILLAQFLLLEFFS